MGEEKKQDPAKIKLTLKTAKELAKRELGSAKGITLKRSYMMNNYHMSLGNLSVWIYLEQIGDRWYIALIADWAGSTGKTVRFFDPETLEQDFGAEERHWEQHRQDQFQDWVEGHGVEYCCQKVKEAWGKQR